jgi:hypothetical protein
MSAFFYYAMLVIESALNVVGVRIYEEPRYVVVERLSDGVEIRRYGPRLAAEVQTKQDGQAGRSEAFRLLFEYIAGANRSKDASSERIAMTTPVATQSARVSMTAPVATTDVPEGLRMRFFLPAKLTRETAPKPLDPRVRLVDVPPEDMAVLRYSGNGKDYPARAAALPSVLSSSRWRPSGEPQSMNYDAPFVPPFLRRNEAAVTVTQR